MFHSLFMCFRLKTRPRAEETNCEEDSEVTPSLYWQSINSLLCSALINNVLYIQDADYVNMPDFCTKQSQQRSQGEAATVKVIETQLLTFTLRESWTHEMYFFLYLFTILSNICVHGFKGKFLYGLYLQEGARKKGQEQKRPTVRRTERWHHHYTDDQSILYFVLHSLIMCFISRMQSMLTWLWWKNNQKGDARVREPQVKLSTHNCWLSHSEKARHMRYVLCLFTFFFFFFLNIHVRDFKGTFLFGLYLQEAADRLPPWWGKCSLQDNVQVKLNKNLHIPSVAVCLWGRSVRIIFLFSGTDCWSLPLWWLWCSEVLMCQDKEETGLPTTDSYKW